MNNLNTKVAVLMSVFGYRGFVPDSIESILNQTYSEFNFIIIDDGCDYDLYKIVRDFKDSRILYLKNENNLGLTRSLIRGLEVSKSIYIVRQDAGNISLPKRIEKQFTFLENNPEYFLVGGSAILIDEEGKELCRETMTDDLNLIKKNMPRFNCIYHSSIMFRNDSRYSYREKFKYSQDYDLYLRLLADNIKFTNIPDILIKERLIESSITYHKRNQQQYYKDLALRFYFERLNTGKDSYCDFKNDQIQIRSGKKENGKDSNKFYFRQKAYLLLYSFKFHELRKLVKKYHKKNKFDFKLTCYFFISYLPFVIKLLKIKKGIKIS